MATIQILIHRCESIHTLAETGAILTQERWDFYHVQYYLCWLRFSEFGLFGRAFSSQLIAYQVLKRLLSSGLSWAGSMKSQSTKTFFISTLIRNEPLQNWGCRESQSFGHVASQTCAKYPNVDFSLDFFARHPLSPFRTPPAIPLTHRQMPKCKISKFSQHCILLYHSCLILTAWN